MRKVNHRRGRRRQVLLAHISDDADNRASQSRWSECQLLPDGRRAICLIEQDRCRALIDDDVCVSLAAIAPECAAGKHCDAHRRKITLIDDIDWQRQRA